MFLRKLVNNPKDQISFLTHALLAGQQADCLYRRLLCAKHPCNMSRTSGGKKGTPPAQAVLGHLMWHGTLSDSLRRDTTFGRGPDELLKHKEKMWRSTCLSFKLEAFSPSFTLFHSLRFMEALYNQGWWFLPGGSIPTRSCSTATFLRVDTNGLDKQCPH